MSHDRANALAHEGEDLRRTVSMATQSDRLLKLVIRFKLDSRAAIPPGPDGMARYAGALTDTAMDIEEVVNALRLDGLGAIDPARHDQVFQDLDRVVEGFVSQRNTSSSNSSARRLDEMLNAATALSDESQARRDQAIARLEGSAQRWNRQVAIFALVLLALALAIHFDISRNILPALRRMHGSLKRLAEGDLDVPIERFKLVELRDLARSLETFRRNALAVQDLAFADPSTDLPNRRAFVQIAPRLLMNRDHDAPAFIALIDIDRFKYINDDFGHESSDRLVRLLGERMREALGEDALLARIGGDEFAIYCATQDQAPPGIVCDALTRAVRQPFELDGTAISITVSIGFAEIESADGDIEHILHRADLALYASKRNGRNRATRFNADLSQERDLDRALERDLAEALGGGQLRMVYQPIYPTTNAAQEIEALVRWRHPRLGEISPGRFIPAAERSGVMPELGAWIVDRALSDLSRWAGLAMSVNLSPIQLQQEGFVSFLLEACQKYRISPRRVILEVTETISIERNARALLTLELLRNAGFRIALDDFGTGYSSLCMMKNFKFDRLKLDRSLVIDIGEDETSRAVFDAAVQMARQIGAEVVAEGVSEEALVETALVAGCTHLQGFHLSQPVEAQTIQEIYDAALRKAERATAMAVAQVS
ncbi:sensor domain-containing phosphodiesterase [Novosphingobium sp. PC22D]|uniref:putative bifunctional diguanylate cyclase/phosphodiesterase n=1 Tax=Novosphingobium sp. PC22D TaxID=1962403 RepID=UPI001F0A9598|nr:sensor domain-containing phosphodiesterase [Novosphingobium sp. PC22D]